jgi:hypothetical protein
MIFDWKKGAETIRVILFNGILSKYKIKIVYA